MDVVVVLAVVLAPAPATAGGPVVIRTYDTSGLAETDRRAALDAAMAILKDAGLAIERLACDDVDARAGAHPCHVPLRAHELSLRLVRLPLDGPAEAGHYVRADRPVTLGYSLVDVPVRFGSLATVYVDRVAQLASASRVDVPTLLGRAIAHEVGHLLLGTNAHAREGVMRAVWSPEALHASPAADWRFTSRDAEALRDAARRRATSG